MRKTSWKEVIIGLFNFISACVLTHIAAPQQWCYLQSIRLIFRLEFGSQSQRVFFFFHSPLLTLRFSYALWYFLTAPVSCQRLFFISGGTRSLKHVAGGEMLLETSPKQNTVMVIRRNWYHPCFALMQSAKETLCSVLTIVCASFSKHTLDFIDLTHLKMAYVWKYTLYGAGNEYSYTYF